MQLYWVGDRYVRTQGEATKLGFGEVTEVPVDKDGLMGFLNELRRKPPQFEALPIPADEDDNPLPVRSIKTVERRDYDAPNGIRIEAVPPEPEYVQRPMDAMSVLSRSDGGADMDSLCERICKSRGHVLARFAKCVALAFEGLKA